MVIGVFAWEEAIDNDRLAHGSGRLRAARRGRPVADEFLVYDLEPNESARTGVKHLFANLSGSRSTGCVTWWPTGVTAR